MSAFRLETVTCRLGYDCSSLAPGAHRLEQSREFKQAAAADFARVFDPWRQDRSFTTPFSGAKTPPAPKVDAHGDVDPASVKTLAREFLAAHLRGGASIDVAAGTTSTCVWVPELREWITIGSFAIGIDGSPYTADAAVDDFEAAYRAARPALPTDFDGDCRSLRSMQALLFVSWRS